MFLTRPFGNRLADTIGESQHLNHAYTGAFKRSCLSVRGACRKSRIWCGLSTHARAFPICIRAHNASVRASPCSIMLLDANSISGSFSNARYALNTIGDMVMRTILLFILWQFGPLAGSRLLADVVVLKDGRQIAGSVESGNIQELHIKVGDQSQTIDIHQVQAIQFGVSLPAPPPPIAPDRAPAASEPAPAQPNSLILHDGNRVTGRWWSMDATYMHFLVNNQLQHFPRSDVSGVTFGNANLPPPPARSTSPLATSAQAPASAAQPAHAPPLERSSAGPAPSSPTLTKPSAIAPSSAPPRGLSQPQEIGMVYSWNGRVLTPLERNQAVEHRGGSAQYWEMPGPHSSVRLSDASSLVFVVYLPKGVDPASYSLFPLVTVEGSRRTRSQPGPRGGLVTLPVDIEKKDGSGVITYALIVSDLPTGEYSFSPSTSNDSYCFGVDPSAPGQ
jgi:hypothetical protein